LSLQFGSITDVGKRRRSNQDRMAIVRGEALHGELDALIVIADGMGGTQGGEIASEMVVETVQEIVADYLADRGGDTAATDAPCLLREAIRESHRRVRLRQAEDVDLVAMGTTCVAAILDANTLTLANVGDSRAYLLREGVLRQVTADHSSVWEQVQAGAMTPEEARNSRFRNQITRAVGSSVNATPDIYTIELIEGDSVLLCSDGLSSEVAEAEIARLLAGVEDPQAACENLLDAALTAGGRDNVTMIALRYGRFAPIALPSTDVLSDLHPRRAPRIGADPIEARAESAEHDPDPLAAMPRRRRHSNSPALMALLLLLTLVAACEGYFLAHVYGALVRARRSAPKIVTVPAARPTDSDLSYGQPAPLTAKLVRNAPFAADVDGGVLAATTDGNLVRIDKQGIVTRLPDQPKREAGRSAPKPEPAQREPLLATDASGNRYLVNPGERAVSKYDPDGVLVTDSIGRGGLTGPSALAVDYSGNLYVVDKHRVMRIVASPPNSASQNRR